MDDDQNLLLLDGNKVISIPDIQIVVGNVKQYQPAIAAFSAVEPSVNVADELLSVLDDIDDAGLILTESVAVLEFLYDRFSTAFPENHQNFKEWTALYQVFLDLIFFRRKERVLKFIKDNTTKFEDDNKLEIQQMEQTANSKFNGIRDHLKLCKQKCAECFYPCLLQKDHENDAEWADEHSCRQSDHTCSLQCTYCGDKGKEMRCGLKCGHKGAHNCKQENHTCGKECSLKKYGGCQLDCDLISGHKGACKCAAETHLCEKTCAVGICKNQCKVAYNKKHTEHICIQQGCPYKCQVMCWNDSLKMAVECGRPCSCKDHDHHLRMERGECKDEGHTCDQTHPCPEECTEDGVCKVEVQRKVVEKATLVTGAGAKIEYDAYAEVNAEKKRCAQRIPVGKFRHDGDDHRCYDLSGDRVIHTCDVQCDSCGTKNANYSCSLEIVMSGVMFMWYEKL